MSAIAWAIVLAGILMMPDPKSKEESECRAIFFVVFLFGFLIALAIGK